MAGLRKDAEVQFSIAGIRELEFTYKDPYHLNKNIQLSAENISAHFELNYKWNIEENKFAVVFKISFLLNKDDDDQFECLRLAFLNEFQVENLKELFQAKDDNKFEINEKLEISLVSITISTARGIIHEKTRGTPLNRFILPIVNPSEVILSTKNK